MNMPKKLHEHAKESTADALKTASKRAIQKTPEETGNLMDSKIADALVSRMTVKLQRSSELHSRAFQKQLQMNQKILDLLEKYLEKDTYLQKKDKIIDDLKLI